MDNQPSPAEREARKERLYLHPICSIDEFVTGTTLSARDAYRRLPEIPRHSPGPPPRFILSHAFDDETILLEFHGTGDAESGGTARIWGVEPLPAGGFTGRFLCDAHLRMGATECNPEGESNLFPPCFRFAQWVDVIDDHAPFPGILLRMKSGMEGAHPPIMLQGQWGFSTYIVELACIPPPGFAPARSLGAMWQAVKFGPPPPLPPPQRFEDMRIVDQEGNFLQEGKQDREGEEWKKEEPDGPEER